MRVFPIFAILCLILSLLLAACAYVPEAAPASLPAASPVVESTAIASTTGGLALTPTLPITLPTSSPAETATQTIPALGPAQPLPEPTDPGVCSEAGGRWVNDYIIDERLAKPLEYRVYLPPCYDPQTEQRYPVLYLIHGQTYDHKQWDQLGIDEAADRLVTDGEMAALIMVTPRDRIWEQPEADAFGEVLVERLVPEVDQNFRTLPERGFRAIGGLSRGAAWAVHLGLSHWDLFGAIGAHSLPVFWSDTPRISRWLAEIPTEALPRIYLDIGDKDRPELLESARWFEGLLTKEGIPHEWYLFHGYHDDEYWSSHLEGYLRWYTAPW